jgi:hypothetical protein
MSPGVTAAMSPCILHGGGFMYDPLKVPVITWVRRVSSPLDVALNRLAEVHAEDAPAGKFSHSGDAGTCAVCIAARELLNREAVNEPICPGCARKLNETNRPLGYPLVSEEDTAAALTREQR